MSTDILRGAISIALNTEACDDEVTLQRIAALNVALLDLLAPCEESSTGLLAEQLARIEAKVDQIMTVQDDINAALAGDDAALKAVADRVAAVEQGLRDEIATLQANGVDTSGLLTHLAALKETADAIDAAAPAPTPVPAPEPAPAPTDGTGDTSTPPPPASTPPGVS